MSDSRVALVTGGSRGAGAGIARGLGELGYTVYVTGRTKSPGDAKGWDGSVLPGTFEETAQQVTQLGGRGIAVQCDHSDDEQVAALFERIMKEQGRLDMLVNNAMSVHYAPLHKLSLEHWRKDFAVNADAVFAGTKAAIAAMRESGGGSIVNVSSTTAIRAAPYMASYSASKAAMIQFTSVAAMEVARENIRVNCVVPGQVQTAGNEDFARKAPEVAAKTVEAIPMGRGGAPEELAAAIVFLLSDAASYITGIALPVDGGKSAQLYLPS